MHAFVTHLRSFLAWLAEPASASEASPLDRLAPRLRDDLPPHHPRSDRACIS